MAALSPGNLIGPGVGAILALAVLGFVGFESAVVFSEESKDPRRTVPTATYIAVGGTALLYAFGSWAMTVATGPDQIVARSRAEGLTWSSTSPRGISGRRLSPSGRSCSRPASSRR